jgi:uracil-DNA glycosylase family 4
MQQTLVVSRSCLDAIGAHMHKWQTCTACPISSPRKTFFRGMIPCDVLIIGGGPLMGDEDIGKPMAGDNGAIIDAIIDETIAEFTLHTSTGLPHRKLKTCIVNSVLCRGPTAPDKEAIRACSSRLAEFILIAKPRLLIAAGKEASSAIINLLAHLPEYPRSLEIRAPGYIGRLSGDDRDLEMSRAKLQISQALLSTFGKKD